MEAALLLTCLQTAGLTVTRTGDQLIVAPRDRLTDELRNAIRDAKPKLLSALTPNGMGMGVQLARPSTDIEQRIRLMAKRWGFSAEELAEALTCARSENRSNRSVPKTSASRHPNMSASMRV
jgi:hypothetical protein